MRSTPSSRTAAKQNGKSRAERPRYTPSAAQPYSRDSFFSRADRDVGSCSVWGLGPVELKRRPGRRLCLEGRSRFSGVVREGVRTAVVKDRRVGPDACCSSLAWLRRTAGPRMEDREEVLMGVGCESAEETHRERREGLRAIMARLGRRFEWGRIGRGRKDRVCEIRRELFFLMFRRFRSTRSDRAAGVCERCWPTRLGRDWIKLVGFWVRQTASPVGCILMRKNLREE